MVHLISTICLFGNRHHQYRFGRTPRIGDRSQSTLSEAPSLGRSPPHLLRCPLDSRLCRPAPRPAREIFRIYHRNFGAYLPTYATIRISLKEGAGRLDMLVYPSF